MIKNLPSVQETQIWPLSGEDPLEKGMATTPVFLPRTVHGILQARILQWVAFPFSRGILPTQGSNPGFPHCRWILYHLSHQGSPRILEWVAYPFSSRSSQPRNRTGVSYITGGFFTNWAFREAQGRWRGLNSWKTKTMSVFCLVLVKISKKQRHYFANKGPSSQDYRFSSSHVWKWELDYKESWAPKNWCFWTVVLEKTLESPLDFKEIQPVHPKGNQSWIVIGRTDAEAETPILWPPDGKS